MLTNLLMGLIGLMFLAAFAYEVARARDERTVWSWLAQARRDFLDAFSDGYRGVPRGQSASR